MRRGDMSGAEAILQIVELANAAKGLAGRGQQGRNTAERVVRALRALYFTPAATLGLLESIAQGEAISEAEIEAALPAFNDKEWSVGRSLDDLDYRSLERDGELSLRQCRVLSEIAHGKRTLRNSVQECL